MAIRIREVEGVNILDIDGRVDINSSDIVEMVGWLVNTGKVNVILNFENVDLIDYNGLSVLVIAYKNVKNHKGKMKFLHVPISVIELFKVVKLDSVFETYQDEAVAVDSFFNEELTKVKMRRKFARLDIHLTVKYRQEGGKNDRQFEGELLNISAAGVYIYTPKTFPVNTHLELEMPLPGLKAPMSASGRVMYIADREIQPHAYPGMGVAFASLSPDKEKSIVDFIDKNVTHRAEPI